MVFSSSLYDTLPTRPPTPPKDLNRDLSEALDFLDDSFEVARTAAGGLLAAPNIDTPPEQSPSSSAEAVTNTSGKKSKRVGFSPWMNYQRAPDSLRESTERAPKVLRPSKDKKALKSILKPSDISIPLTPTESDPGRPGYFSAHNYKSFGEMLQSVVQQLARDSRTSRLDAYMALLGTWKAYEDVPEPEAMKKKMGLFMGFIRRDLVAMRTPTDPDSQIVTQALKLLTSIVCTPTLSACLDDEFRSFVIEHSTIVIGRGSSPKAIINHHLFLLAKQDFPTKLLTPSRADKILVALQDIQDQVTGSSVITYRLKVYEKLLCQAENVMVARISDWLEHIFHGMLSNVKETRNCAIDVGRKAGILLGTNSQATKAVIELFKSESESGSTYGDYFGARLTNMVANKEHGPYAAQIWAVVVLFFRSQRLRLEQWQHLKPWLLIIQRCLNTSDLNIRFQALDAWNRLVFVVGPREGTSWPMRKMLRLPISTQLEKKLSSEPTKQAYRMALSSYCNLLYYAFRPDASHKQLDLYWDEYVNQVLGRMACGSAHDRKMAARILTALFGGFPCQRWNGNRANENSNMKPEELPRLDPRWLRQRISIVMKVVEPCLGLDPLINPSSWDKASGPAMWLSLMASLCEAGSQEITASMDLKEAIAQLMNTLHRLWSNCSPEVMADDGASIEWTMRCSVLVQSAMEKLGPMHFTDRLLSRNNETDFEAAPTPSHRSSKHHGSLQSPILHLLDMFSKAPVQVSRSDMYMGMIKAALRLCCDSRSSRHLKVELLKECAQQVSNAESTGNDNAGRESIWCGIAEVTVAVVDNHSLGMSERGARQFGHELRDVVKILSIGFQYPSRQCLEAGKRLYCGLVECAKREIGVGGTVLAVVEPVAEALKVSETPPNGNITLFYASLVVEQCPQPNTRQEMDQGRKALWGIVLPPAKTAVFEPFNHLYQIIDNTLASSYKTLDSSDVEPHVRFLTNLATFFQRCPLSLSVLLLRKIQSGVAVWIEDSEQKLTGTEEGIRKMHITVVELWKEVCTTTSRLPRKDSTLLKAIEPLIASGLMAQRKAIVNATIELWNTTFGAEKTLEYPPKVEGALRRLRPAVDLQLPTFPESTTDEISETLPSFLESQEDMEYLQPPSGTGRPRLIETSLYHKQAKSPARSILLSSPLPTQLHASTPGRRIKGSTFRQTSKSRLRHEDSQIQFAPINSSPTGSPAMESQLLTDHQKEVRSRQHGETAVMFPDIRSSPTTKNPQVKSHLPQLNLSSDLPTPSGPEEDRPTTPTLPTTTHELMDDLLGSSPTPVSAQRTQPPSNSVVDPVPQVRVLRSASMQDDPPSSPPSMEDDDEPHHFFEEGLQDLTESDVVPATENYGDTRDIGLSESNSETACETSGHAESNKPPKGLSTDRVVLDDPSEEFDAATSDVPSDYRLRSDNSELPTAQLTAEFNKFIEQSVYDETPEEDNPLPEVSARLPMAQNGVPGSDDLVDATTELPISLQGQDGVQQDGDISQSPVHCSEDPVSTSPEKRAVREPPQQDAVEGNENQVSFTSRRTTRAVDASVVPAADKTRRSSRNQQQQSAPHVDIAGPEISTTVVQDTPQAMKKRKGSSTGETSTAKRTKRQSPIKKTIFRVLGIGAPGDDEDVGDCIEVATRPVQSKPSSWPTAQSTPTTSPKKKDAKPAKQKSGVPSVATAIVADSQPARGKLRSLKRRASALEAEGDEADQAAAAETQLVKDTPAPARKRGRPRLSQDARVTRSQGASQGTPQESAPTPRTRSMSTTRELDAVVIETSDPVRATTSQRADGEQAADEGPPPSRDTRTADGQSSRRTAQPKSIMDRLRGILADCRSLVLGSQEERELDDVLFEVRREVHEAGRRSRDG